MANPGAKTVTALVMGEQSPRLDFSAFRILITAHHAGGILVVENWVRP
jgi:hypothetical protein